MPPTSVSGTSCSSAGSTTRRSWRGRSARSQLGPHEYNSKKAQGVAVVLPDKDVETVLPAPVEGERQWWSGEGDGYTAEMSRADIAVPAGGATLDLQLNYNIEEDFDYALPRGRVPSRQRQLGPAPDDRRRPDPTRTARRGRERHRRGQRRLRAGVLRPHAVRRADHRSPGPLHHRRWRAWARTRAWVGPGSSSTTSR